MSSIFSKIVRGEIPCFKIAEDNEFLAFLDVSPLVEGHTLVIPKKEIDYFFDLNDQVLGRMVVFAKNVAKAIEKAIPCKRIGLSVIGLEVPHAHIHLIPLNQMDDINFSRPKPEIAKERLNEIAKKIVLHVEHV